MSREHTHGCRLANIRLQPRSRTHALQVSLGGFDAHKDLAESLDANLDQVDNAIGAFVDELRNASLLDSVAIFSQSDFARTLTSNGQGTDHGWGGHHFLIGGGVAACGRSLLCVPWLPPLSQHVVKVVFPGYHPYLPLPTSPGNPLVVPGLSSCTSAQGAPGSSVQLGTPRVGPGHSEIPATASAARASRLQGRRLHCVAPSRRRRRQDLRRVPVGPQRE